MKQIGKGNTFEASLHLTILDEIENILEIVKDMPDGTSLIQDMQRAIPIRRTMLRDEYQGKQSFESEHIEAKKE